MERMDTPETNSVDLLKPYNYNLLEADTAVSVSIDVLPADQEVLWPMVQQGFIDLNRKSYEKQDMTYEEFQADMTSPAVLKYVARDSEGKPVGYLTVHSTLASVPWVDDERIRKEQAVVDPAGNPFFVGTLVVPQELRGMGVANDLIRGALRHFKQFNDQSDTDSLVFFDCARANHPWLAEFIEQVANSNQGADGFTAKATEFATEYLTKDVTGAVVKAEEAPADPEDVLDSEHYYALRII
jgi:hypothetical protein